MPWNEAATDVARVSERGFSVTTENGTVPGVYWTPTGVEADRLILLGHGGTTHKKIDYIEAVAQGLADLGLASMAIDGPGHGERPSSPGIDGTDGSVETLEKLWNDGGGTEGAITDWRAALDFIESEFGARPTGWWGLSMGTMMGLPVTATDGRIEVALLGLMGSWGPNADDLMRLAPEVTCPVRFLVQWDDEIVPRQACLELFDALGTNKKTLHANPGAHAAIPRFENEASIDYLAQRLRRP